MIWYDIYDIEQHDMILVLMYGTIWYGINKMGKDLFWYMYDMIWYENDFV